MNGRRYQLGDREVATADHVVDQLEDALAALDAAQETTTNEPGPKRPWARQLGQLVSRARDTLGSAKAYRAGLTE